MAEELGLTPPAEADSALGFSACTMPDETAEVYAAEIAELDAALGATIPTVTEAELCAVAWWVGLCMGGFVSVSAWWVKSDPAGMLGTMGGLITKPPTRRRYRRSTRMSCMCRSFNVPAAELPAWDDLDCRRCGTPIFPEGGS